MNKKYIIRGICVVLVSIVLGTSYKTHVENEYSKVFDKKEVLGRDRKTYNGWPQEEVLIYDDDSIILHKKEAQVIVKLNDKRGRIKWMLGEDIRNQSRLQLKHLSPLGEDFQWFSSQQHLSILPDLDNKPHTIDLLLFDNSTNNNDEEETLSSAEGMYNAIHYRINETTMTVEQIGGCGKLK